MQPQSSVHPTVPESPLFFPTIHERPVSFSPPPSFSSPKAPGSQRRKSTSFLESQVRHGRPVGPSPLLSADAANWRSDGTSLLGKPPETIHRHHSFDGSAMADGRPGMPNDGQAVYLASVPYNPQAEVYVAADGAGHLQDPAMVPPYDFQANQAYIARPLQSLRLETGMGQLSPQGSTSAPVTAEPLIMLHKVFVPQSAPPVLGQGGEAQPGCVFEFHMHTAGPEGAVYLPHRVYCTRRGSAELEEIPHSSILQSRLQTVTEEHCNHLGPESPLSATFRCNGHDGSSEYSSDSSQQNSSDPREFFSPPPGPCDAASLTYAQRVFQEPHVYFCFPQPGASAFPQQSAVYSQVIKSPAFIIEHFFFFYFIVYLQSNIIFHGAVQRRKYRPDKAIYNPLAFCKPDVTGTHHCTEIWNEDPAPVGL
ncbi:uncharacterized protein PAF06_011129 [Gastrophryne carolinensis]